MPRTLTIVLNLDNASFSEDYPYAALAEVKRTITEALDKIDPEEYGEPILKRLRDINGNRVGFISDQVPQTLEDAWH